jgi:hypothetical protein
MDDADQEAYESQLAWSLGPETFLSHIRAKVDAIKARIEKEYSESQTVTDDE